MLLLLMSLLLSLILSGWETVDGERPVGIRVGRHEVQSCRHPDQVSRFHFKHGCYEDFHANRGVMVEARATGMGNHLASVLFFWTS